MSWQQGTMFHLFGKGYLNFWIPSSQTFDSAYFFWSVYLRMSIFMGNAWKNWLWPYVSDWLHQKVEKYLKHFPMHKRRVSATLPYFEYKQVVWMNICSIRPQYFSHLISNKMKVNVNMFCSLTKHWVRSNLNGSFAMTMQLNW